MFQNSKIIRVAAIIGLPFLWALCIFIFMNMTSPLKSGPFSVLIVFAMIYLFVTSLLYALAVAIGRVVQFFDKKLPLSRRRLYYLMSVISFGPVFILALNTLGQLDVKEVLLVILLLCIGCFYVLRRSRREA